MQRLTSFAHASTSTDTPHYSTDVKNAGIVAEGQRGEVEPGAFGARSLSVRHAQIAQAVSEGLSNKEIGRRLDITEATVKVHLKGLLAKLHLNNRTQLAAWWIEGGRPSALPIPENRPGGRGPLEWDEGMLDTLRRLVASGVSLAMIQNALCHLRATELQEGFFLLLRERSHS